MIKIDTKQLIKRFNGEAFMENGKELTLGIMVSNILGGKVSNPTLGYTLGKKFATEASVELKAEDVVFIKKEIEDNSKSGGYFAVAAGQAIEILEGNNK